MANEFKIKHGFISTGNGSIEGTLDVSTGININGSAVATRSWVTSTGLSGYATETYVTTQISNLVASAPDALNTLNELADALGDDPNFATTVNTNISGKVSKTGDTMTGALRIQEGANDQSNTSDTTTIPSTTGAEFLKIEGGYTDGRYTTEFAKIDRGGNLPLYIRQSKGTANSFINLARFGDHSNSVHEFEVFGSIKASGGDSGNWNTAYGWGDHSAAGYITSETDTLASVTSRGNTTTNAITVGPLTASSGYFGSTGSNPRIRIYTEDETTSIADTFADTTTDKSYIYFDQGTNSSDPGYIMHETSNSETNEGVLHLVPSDDNASVDYVSIHGTNDQDALRLSTNGYITTSNSYQLTLSSGNGHVRINDGLSVQSQINTDSHGDSSQWNQAYGWGDHGSRGYSRITAEETISGNKTFTGNFLRTSRRISTGRKYPLGHYTPGETLFELDPTWTDAELQAYFNKSNVSWVEDPTAPGGYCIYIDGSAQVGGDYSSGFPYIPIDEDGIYYMEVYIKNAGSGQTHYMGSIDYNESFAHPDSGGGNPGSYGYWTMSNTNPGTEWTKQSGYISGFSANATGTFETGAKYWTPQALFNYGAGTGTRACWISGWKVIRVDQVGDRTFRHNVDVLGDLNVTSEATVGDKLYLTNVASSGQDGILAYDSANTASGSRIFSFTRGGGNSLKYHSYGYHIWYSGPASGLSDSTARMILDSSGNLGIGTTSPGTQLEAYRSAGQSNISVNAGGNRAYLFANNGGNWGLWGFENQPFTLATNSQERLRITNTGNIGIGTTSPNSKLDVRGDIRTTGFSLRDSGQTENHARIYSDGTNGYLSINNGNNWGFIVRGHDNSPMIGAYHGGQLRIRGFGSSNGFNHANDIDVATINFSTRRVGIGTTSPASTLHVNGDKLIFTQTGQTYTDGSSGLTGIGIRNTGTSASYNAFGIQTGSGQVFQVRNNGDVWVRKHLHLGTSDTNTFSFRLTRTNASVVQDAHLYSPSNNSPSVFYMEGGYYTGEAAGTVTAANSGHAYYERYFGGGSANSYKHLGFTNTTGNFTSGNLVPSIAMKSDGKVGIGTANPSGNLHVAGGGTSRFTLSNSNGQQFQIYSWASGTNIYNGASSNADIWFGRDATVANNFYFTRNGNNHTMKIDTANERVGIGTTNPAYKLDISGGKMRVSNSGTTQLLINSTNSGSRELVFQGNGSTKAYVWNASEFIGMGKGSGSNSLFVGVGGASEGNVGIGTSTPSDRLTVHNGGSTTRAFIYNSGGSGHEAKVEVYTADDGAGHPGGAAHLRSWGWGNAEVRVGGSYLRQSGGRMNFISSGQIAYFDTANVGIGVYSPVAKLDVAGSIKTSGYFFGNELRANLDSGSRIVLHDGAGNMEFRTQGGTERMTITYGGNVGIGTNTPVAPLQVAPASDYKVVKLGGDTISHYTITGFANHTLTLTCGSYYQAEVVITAHQTNDGEYNNLYIRGIWSNNHHSHRWDILEEIGGLTGSDFNFINEQNDVENSGKLQIDHIYNNGSFALLTVRVTEYYGTHSYTIA